MHLWFFKKTKQDRSGAEKFAYVDRRQLLLFQQTASPFAAPIVKNLRPIGNINPVEGGLLASRPATLSSGYGGIVSGQMVLQPLQDMSIGSGGV